MPYSVGIVGLPNAGKSTIFNAIAATQVQVASYPFSTINPNAAIVPVPDERLERLSSLMQLPKVTPAVIEFVDIAGLIKGSSQGEGLGNQFLAHIREADAVALVLCCFRSGSVTHPYGSPDPIRDAEIIQTELLLADLQTVTARINKLQRQVKSGDHKVKHLLSLCQKLKEGLERGRPARALGLTSDESGSLTDLHLLTAKPALYVANLGENGGSGGADYLQGVVELASGAGVPAVAISGKLEAELAELPPEERVEFMEALEVEETAKARLIQACYQLLGLITFYTMAGKKELRAWAAKSGATAHEAAGMVHSDMERGFIMAEVVSCQDLLTAGSEHVLRQQGHIRQEGRDYTIQDGDILHIKFNI